MCTINHLFSFGKLFYALAVGRGLQFKTFLLPILLNIDGRMNILIKKLDF